MPRRIVQAERRHLKQTAEHEKWNFLQDKTKDHSMIWNGKDSNLGETRFHKGFHRKRADKIKEDRIRSMPEYKQHSEMKSTRRIQTAQDRRENLRKTLQRNGNIITGQGMPEEPKLGRKYISEEPCAYMKRESRVRMQTGGSRFFIPLSPRKTQKNLRRQEPRIKQIEKQRSSVIGYGRSELQSLGALDNFSEIPAVKAKRVVP
mmetsp:Transcript_9532/g.13326  ORF Transcript_9532/g.13326 Transcript_9532/m.13326 type:complete len:204 (+) Transcript_9532:107-718(+)